jgi:hypothetical protein
MMIHAASSIQIDLPIQAVYHFVAVDFFTNYPKWSPQVTQLVKTSDGEMGVGVTGHQVRYDAGRRSEADFRVTHYLPLRELRFVGLSRPRFTVRYRFQPLTEGTRILFDFELQLELLMRPFRRLIEDTVRRGAQRMLRDLKALLESDAASAARAVSTSALYEDPAARTHQSPGDHGRD